MEYKVDNAELTATLTAVNLDAAVIEQAPLEVAVGESARIDVGTAINYIKSGEAEIEAAVQEGTAAFDLHANEKRADFNENASNKTATFNQNASNKTAAFNTNAESQFDDYNANASIKLNAYNDNATTKTTAFNDNAIAQTTAFNENAAIKQAAVDASADAAAASATTAKQYAIGVPSEPSGYSAKYWAEQTAQSLSGLQSDVAGIKAVIPTSATASNKLTDKSYVDTADNNLQSQIDAITASSDVTDIVGTYAELQSYDTSALPPNSIIKVLQDESRNNETTYYRWVITGGVGAWSLIGEEGPYYTISAADAKFATQTALSTGLAAKQNTLISGTNIKTVNNQSLLGSGDLNITASVLWGGIGGTLSNQTDLQNALNTKQDVISDLSTIRSGAALGATAVQPAALANYVDTSTNQTIAGTKTFSSTISGSINGNAATVTNGVYTDTDQTISGQKTFGKYIQIFNSDSVSGIIGQNTGITKGTAPTTAQEFRFYTHDSGGRLVANRLGGVVNLYQTNGTIRTALQAFKPTANNNTRAEIYVDYPSSGSAYVETTAYLRPSSDNSLNLGDSSHRWKQLYAGTTTIATSDERLKQGIENVPDTVLDAWGEVDFYRYKFNDSVAEKGFDNARYHTGMVAQRIERIFAEHGLNAFDYGLLCFDEWAAEPEVRDEENEIIRPAHEAGNRYSLRYEECLCMEAAYQRRRADRIEKRLNALEARL